MHDPLTAQFTMFACGGHLNASTTFAPPPSAPREHDGSLVSLGVVLCELAVCGIALGANIQRYGLTKIMPSRRCFCGIR